MKKIQRLDRIPMEERRCRTDKPLWLIRAACIVWIAVLSVSAFADGGKEIQEETIVSLVWEDRITDVTTTEWYEHSVQIHTEDVGMGNGKVCDFVGVTLFDLMKLAGADGCSKALVKSTDGLVGEVAAEDIRNYDIALVNGYAGGKPVSQPAGGFPGNSAGPPVKVSSEKFGHVDQCVIIILDGFSSNYLSRLGPDSGLVGISRKGACCLTARSTYPTHTCTNHATIMTGVGAAKHGIVGNDRLGEDGMSSVRNIQPEMIRVPTLIQAASAAGKKTAFVSGKDNMVSLFAEGLDIGVSNKRLTDDLSAAPELTDSSSNDEYFRYNMDLADWVFESLFTVLEKESPDLTVVNIQSADTIGHRFGPGSEEMAACLLALDERLGELYRKMEKAGMLEDTAVIVTADHGMTPSDKAIPLTALSVMNFPDAGVVADGRNGYIWYGREDREAVMRFYKNVEGIRNVFERDSDEAAALNVNYAEGPDLFLETEPGYVFLPGPMIDFYHGQHGSRDDSDAVIPILCFGSGIPAGTGIESSDLRCIAPIVCRLMDLPSGSFDLGIPALLEAQDRTIFGR